MQRNTHDSQVCGARFHNEFAGEKISWLCADSPRTLAFVEAQQRRTPTWREGVVPGAHVVHESEGQVAGAQP